MYYLEWIVLSDKTLRLLHLKLLKFVCVVTTPVFFVHLRKVNAKVL